MDIYTRTGRMSTGYRIIIVGKTGNGKSSLGNVLLEWYAFNVARCFNAVTAISEVKRNEKNVSVVDTPGLFCSGGKRNLAEQALEVQQAIKLCPNPDAILIVLNGSTRLTQEELSTIAVLCIVFGEQCLERAIIVLTHTENNVDETQLREMLETSSEMSNLVSQCGDRFARIDNREPKPEHIERIFSLVDQISRRRKDSFRNEFLYVHKRVLKEAVKNLDSGPVHEQVRRLSEQIMKAVEEEKFYRKCLKAAGVGAVCVAAGAAAYLAGGSAAVKKAVTNPETAQVVIEKSINAAAGLIKPTL